MAKAEKLVAVTHLRHGIVAKDDKGVAFLKEEKVYAPGEAIDMEHFSDAEIETLKASKSIGTPTEKKQIEAESEANKADSVEPKKTK